MTTQPELPEVAALPARPILRLAPAPAEQDLDFDSFVRSYETRLRRLVMRRIGDLCEAEEITQETLLRAYQHRASFSSEDELMAWSTVVAQRLVIDRVRVRGRSVAVADVPETARLGRDTAEVVVARHEARAALESLEAIPTRQAAILWAREVEGLHYEEIAERFGITEPAVRSLLHRGRKALRKEFKDRTGSLPLGGLAPFAPWLMALKAAGKVRATAKTVAKSPGLAAAALGVTGLLAVGITQGIGGAPVNPGVRINAAPGGVTSVRQYVEPAAAVEHVRPALRATLPKAPRHTVSATAVTPPSGPRDGTLLPGRSRCTPDQRLCGHSGEFEYQNATIQVGPELPDNPTHTRSITVMTDHVTCDQTHLPQDGAPITCTQHGEPPPDDGGLLPPTQDSTEGALR
ncbi:MAG TPA: RNA polymerase sigma factor [Mycobacteriales bacterium]|nr:RNA polymerase sigma factor [Mycobacteriales bacterium]